MAFKDIVPGTYEGKVISGKFGQSGEKKTPGVGVEIEFMCNGVPERLWWTGWLSAAAQEKTVEQLIFLGYDTDSGNEPDGTILVGKHIDPTVEFKIVVEMEEYEKDGQTKTAPKIKWINRPGGSQLATMEVKEVSAMMAAVDIKKLGAAARASLGMKKTTPKSSTSGLPNYAPGANNPPPLNTDELLDAAPGQKPPF